MKKYGDCRTCGKEITIACAFKHLGECCNCNNIRFRAWVSNPNTRYLDFKPLESLEANELGKVEL